MVGAGGGFLCAMPVVLLSDPTTSNAGADLAVRGTVVCIFVAVAAAVGWLGGWVIDRMRGGK
jgi:hypothetical protein